MKQLEKIRKDFDKLSAIELSKDTSPSLQLIKIKSF